MLRARRASIVQTDLDVADGPVDGLLIVREVERAREAVERDPGFLNGNGFEPVGDSDGRDGPGVVCGTPKGGRSATRKLLKGTSRSIGRTGLDTADADERVTTLLEGVGDEVLKLAQNAVSDQLKLRVGLRRPDRRAAHLLDLCANGVRSTSASRSLDRQLAPELTLLPPPARGELRSSRFA
jgi:hypothetical protein